ncbi:hypothetical protein C1H76_4360 [Elsinoe australis]|uniref:Telomere length regulation protein conserved domain-containing protein n=1 Tax=Elsinoe australis TaxID=40998 RepID=A0A4U7AXJ7_9PEZI|nr:hypothetical protein C1H76_4360 [Elsinoe australis]
MSDLFSAVSTVSLKSRANAEDNEEPAFKEISTKKSKPGLTHVPTISARDIESPDGALVILRSQPDDGELNQTLDYLIRTRTAAFDIRIPGPKSTSLLRELVTTTLPDFWDASGQVRSRLVDCLRSVPGLSALISEIKLSVNRSQSRRGTESRDGAGNRNVHIEALQAVLSGDSLIWTVWKDVSEVPNQAQRRLLWRDFMALIASGKVVSTTAEHEDVEKKKSLKASNSTSWLADGSRYASWVASTIGYVAVQLSKDDGPGWTALAELLTKCGSLGYSHELMTGIIRYLVRAGLDHLQNLSKLVTQLRSPERKRFLLQLLASVHKLVPPDQDLAIKQSSTLLVHITSDDTDLRKEMTTWLIEPQTCCTTPQSTRRAVLATLRTDQENLQTVFEGSMKIFGEVMFIRHAPGVQQEVCAEVLLLSAGSLNRQEPASFRFLARSSVYAQAVSNRLNASSEKSRMLGMCVAMAISSLIDQGDKQLKFDLVDVKTDKAKNLMGLVQTVDTVGTLHDLQLPESPAARKEGTTDDKSKQRLNPATAKRPSRPTTATNLPIQTKVIGSRIVEVLSDDEDSIADRSTELKAYPKPDSDPEDSDDDPTVVNRDKPKTPVYIRDLIAGLQDQDKYDRHKIALEQAGPLIRRKAKFGKEVSDHATELGLILIGLQDHFELDGFTELRLQALIALLMSNPSELGPWYAQQAFEGDYSISQRGTILSAIGLSARELAGYMDTDALNPSVAPKDSFPSKRLPEKYHAIYATPSANPSQPKSIASSPLNTITSSLTASIITPLAATAADAQTGPTILKTRTFSSRLSTSPSSRTRRIPNTLSTLLHSSFFTPLLGAFYTHTSNPSSRTRNIYLQPHFLAVYLKTVAILVHASGPGTVSLPSLTAEFWALLLGLRAQAKEDQSVMEAVLFGFLALLEVNEDTRRVAGENGREVVETREWVGTVFARLQVGQGEEEEERLRGLAAGVLVKCGEVMEKWERLMVGEMMDY